MHLDQIIFHSLFFVFNTSEKGYEEWDKYSSGDDEPIVERGLEGSEDALDFNVIPKLMDDEGTHKNKVVDLRCFRIFIGCVAMGHCVALKVTFIF